MRIAECCGVYYYLYISVANPKTVLPFNMNARWCAVLGVTCIQYIQALCQPHGVLSLAVGSKIYDIDNKLAPAFETETVVRGLSMCLRLPLLVILTTPFEY